MNFPSIGSTNVVGMAELCMNQHHIFATVNIVNIIQNEENHEK